MSGNDTADFGFSDVAADRKAALVGSVFSQVAPYYDRMNDVMSLGLHRLWKNAAVAVAAVRPGMKVLDLACGSGDLAARLLPQVAPHGKVTLADINANMLAGARARLRGHLDARYTRCNGESLPFSSCSFDRVLIGFGLRNVTQRETALAEMYRVLRPGGLCLIMEFSPPQGILAPLQRHYLTAILPRLGKRIANDTDSYRYLGESILRFPDRHRLSSMMEVVGFSRVQWLNVAAGAVMLHYGRRLS
ncbi:class I SAM-dependent methyltransferase [Candidatus Persebacteraceae bacterium Df01]|jgi:demethylmenaquinone methyltransferase/2-methoxy-6-polyprenyl-1,4-benzoquinol methylase|uniref:Ubiquinone/menaquinone biosynthesis C-methyltransferase UbiE n=1 Tax=Candidatus Doriopsillibacter californiensis TaxID=2970740 RepID=A0ABT7QN66_9GAMM|nr:class I SAM-dependent methyltransferase [Candidatus Persebacteraceae bacterium Df01]